MDERVPLSAVVRMGASRPARQRLVMNPDQAWVISRRFPGLVFWFGRCTRSWWALVWVPSGWRLVEAADTDQLTRAVLEARTWPWPRTATVSGSGGERQPSGEMRMR
ncbi:hypothetical protein GCM10023196_074190 [Actinoallomurus vinaceus]|uniref:Transposase n=1 Tax=Actinoallomurus vinaceus TaxID=1080074 RepID=A0ABP8UK15_9ACTN